MEINSSAPFLFPPVFLFVFACPSFSLSVCSSLSKVEKQVSFVFEKLSD